MMTETQQFLEQLKDPMRFGIRKACFDFHNSGHNKEIYDLRIQQVNELEYYHILLITDNFNQHIGMVNDFADMLTDYTPHNVSVSYKSVEECVNGKYRRTFYVYGPGITGLE